MNLPIPLRILLWPFSMFYAAAMRLRTTLYTGGWLTQKRLSGRVISVGNLTVGGTGKTPTVIWLAEKFLADGKRVAILSRGYQGSGKTSDEIELMKDRLQGHVLFGVGKDRYAEGKRLESSGVDIFLLDDGFQHLRLARDLNILLLDSTRPLQQEWILPSGRLREPRSALGRADIVLVTRTEQSKNAESTLKGFPQMPRYSCATKLLGFRQHGVQAALRPLYADPVFAFAGIGNPDAFFTDLERWNVRVVGRKSFRDHHCYKTGELHELTIAAQRLGAKALMTTEKDAQNLGLAAPAGLPVQIAVVAIEIPDEDRFLRDVRDRLALSGGVAA